MSEHAIPANSMTRIRQQYGQFEQLVQVVAEAMGIDGQYQIDMARGLLVVPDPPGMGPVEANGVADTPVPATVD